MFTFEVYDAETCFLRFVLMDQLLATKDTLGEYTISVASLTQGDTLKKQKKNNIKQRKN